MFAYRCNFDFEYIHEQRGGDQLCMVSLRITQNGSETRITCVRYNDNVNNTKNFMFSFCYGYDNNTPAITVCVHSRDDSSDNTVRYSCDRPFTVFRGNAICKLSADEMTANKPLSVDFVTDKQELLLKYLPVSKDNNQANRVISYTANLPATYGKSQQFKTI